MSKQDAIVIVSRATALYLFCWAFDTFSYLPEHLMNVQRLTSSDFHRLYMVVLEVNILRGVALLAVAMCLYECGPRVQAFLLPTPKQADNEQETPAAGS